MKTAVKIIKREDRKVTHDVAISLSRVRAREETKAALTDANDVARTQFIRFRRRLGSLTHEQELQIENLLISTVSKISLMAAGVMEAMTKNPLTTLEWLETRQYEQEPDDS